MQSRDQRHHYQADGGKILYAKAAETTGTHVTVTIQTQSGSAPGTGTTYTIQ